uniref:ventricular zone-expressed PH domain-containing protein-like isoform X2 n=1 Tax=Oncorhynchus gorbuscha TaxID=8017 RepID=UPI001EAF2292|nr:ventricular zone-expressed PH domain-containing protein-like isoform X2 [Oncorhynchus gorbuscha]
MHQLLGLVLGKRDLSRAGDLFSLEDSEIEDCLSQALEEIKAISCSPDYLTNDNDQAVVEICITRITTAIRETRSIERHGGALVGLWESCLEHNLTPQGKDEDTPHAKIASDITSCILQNYSRPPVMALAVPVAVRFLQRGNRELSRNMSSYLSLAAMAKAELLAEHTEAITCSVLGGNHMLLRVLPSIYPKQPHAIHRHLGNLTAMMSQLDSPEQQHLLRLIRMVAEQQPLVLSPLVPSLVGYLGDASLNETLLGALVDVSQASPASMTPFLPALRVVGQQYPVLLGHVVKIHRAVGLTSERQARSSLAYLVSLLGSMDHSFHYSLLLEIRALTDRYTSILGGCAKDIYRMSNSFTSIARLLETYTTINCRVEEESEGSPSPEANVCGGAGGFVRGSERRLQVKIQAFEEKMVDEGGEGETDGGSTTPQRRYSMGQAAREEYREMRFNRSKSLALHAMRSRSINSESGPDGEGVELTSDALLSGSPPNQQTENIDTSPTERELTNESSLSPSTRPAPPLEEQRDGQGEGEGRRGVKRDTGKEDKLYNHLRDNMEKIKEFCSVMVQQIPIPEHCVIEDSSRGCVAKLSFSCSLKGHYCLFTKSCFTLTSLQPHLWINIMLLHLQDLDSLQILLEEVRFFDLFGFSEEEGSWLCYMCNNPEKATVVNEDGQPLIEGKLKEKQVRWKFIKRWKTRYFTLAGNQLLFRKGKSKDELDDSTIELSKVQSVKVVAKKRRERGLPRAFEIFTDSKTYVLKARDEKHAEEWLQCINVAVAQARERENREATTYL